MGRTYMACSRRAKCELSCKDEVSRISFHCSRRSIAFVGVSCRRSTLLDLQRGREEELSPHLTKFFFSSSTRMRLQSGSFAQCRHVCGVKAQMSLCRVSGWEMEIPLRSPWTLGCTGRMTCCGSSQLMHGVGLSSVLCLAFMAVTSLSSEAHISVCVEVEREWPAQDHEMCRLLFEKRTDLLDWRCQTEHLASRGH